MFSLNDQLRIIVVLVSIFMSCSYVELFGHLVQIILNLLDGPKSTALHYKTILNMLSLYCNINVNSNIVLLICPSGTLWPHGNLA